MSVVVLSIQMPETRGYSLEFIQDGFQAMTVRRPLTRKMGLRRLFTGPSLLGPEQATSSSVQPAGRIVNIELGSLTA